MPYSEALRDRILSELDEVPVTHKKMFGGLGVFYQGNMFAGISGDRLMIKVPDAAAELGPGIDQFHTMKQWILMDEPEDLAHWLGRGLETIADLPPKS